MRNTIKIQLAGVGGQGVVFLANVLVEAALVAGIDVATSEIHGLSQRGGSVNAGVTFGEYTCGLIEKAGADFLLGLETLEAQRCLPFLNKGSRVVVDDNRIFPYSVNAGVAVYPDSKEFIDYLKNQIKEVVFIDNMPSEVDSISRNLFVVGAASQLEGFPVKYEHLQQAIKNLAKKSYLQKSLDTLALGKEY